jgi:hypothetical protein
MLLLGLSLVSASFLGWSLAASLSSQTSALTNRTDDDLQAEQLLDRLEAQGELAPEHPSHTARTPPVPKVVSKTLYWCSSLGMRSNLAP